MPFGAVLFLFLAQGIYMMVKCTVMLAFFPFRLLWMVFTGIQEVRMEEKARRLYHEEELARLDREWRMRQPKDEP